MALSFYGKLHTVHRCWRLRFKSEVPSIRYVREAPLAGATVLDIGANKGVYSIYMSRAAGPTGRLVAFEAQPELGAHLEHVRESFSLANMTLVNKGLSSAPGVLAMHRPAAGSGMATFHSRDTRGLECIEVPVIRLDDYAEESGLGPVSFIKCDVEGHELDVFRGGEKLLRRDLPVLLFECDDAAAARGELFDFLDALGYDGWFFYVSPEDHLSWRHKGRGRYVHFSAFADYGHARAGIHHRNYVFLPKGQEP